MIFAKKKNGVVRWPPEDRVISIFAGCLANHDRAHRLLVHFTTLLDNPYWYSRWLDCVGENHLASFLPSNVLGMGRKRKENKLLGSVTSLDVALSIHNKQTVFYPRVSPFLIQLQINTRILGRQKSEDRRQVTKVDIRHSSSVTSYPPGSPLLLLFLKVNTQLKLCVF